MNRLREFMGLSSGLAPIRLERRWVVSVLAGLVVLLGINKADADPVCSTPTPTCIPCPISWTQCFDCSSNSEHPICARAEADPAEPEAKYLYCTYALDALCNFYIVDCWYSSTPCSEAVPVPTTATNQETICSYYDEVRGLKLDRAVPALHHVLLQQRYLATKLLLFLHTLFRDRARAADRCTDTVSGPTGAASARRCLSQSVQSHDGDSS